MGLPAVGAGEQPPPQLNDIAIVGYFASVHPGSIAKGFVIGFGSAKRTADEIAEKLKAAAQRQGWI